VPRNPQLRTSALIVPQTGSSQPCDQTRHCVNIQFVCDLRDTDDDYKTSRQGEFCVSESSVTQARRFRGTFLELFEAAVASWTCSATARSTHFKILFGVWNHRIGHFSEIFNKRNLPPMVTESLSPIYLSHNDSRIGSLGTNFLNMSKSTKHPRNSKIVT